MSPFTLDEKKRLFRAVMGEEPPTLGVVGASGSGKSSFINESFSTKLPISHTKACTKEFWRLTLEVIAKQGDLKGLQLRLGVRDAPGLGEDRVKDREYLRMYAEELPNCDVVVYLINARNRAIALDQEYLGTLHGICPNLIFGLSQVDLVAPMNWPQGLPIPSKEQERNIEEIVVDRQEKLSTVLGYSPTIIPISSARGYNLEPMFTAILRAAPNGRKWLFDLIKGYRLEDWIPRSVLRGRKEVKTARSDGREIGELLRSVRTKLETVFGPGSEREMLLKLSEMMGRDQVDPKKMSKAELQQIERSLVLEQIRRASKKESI